MRACSLPRCCVSLGFHSPTYVYGQLIVTIVAQIGRCKEMQVPSCVALQTTLSFILHRDVTTIPLHGASENAVSSIPSCRKVPSCVSLALSTSHPPPQVSVPISTIQNHCHKPNFTERLALATDTINTNMVTHRESFDNHLRTCDAEQTSVTTQTTTPTSTWNHHHHHQKQSS